MAVSVTGIGPQLKRNGQSKVCVFGADLAVDDRVKIVVGTEAWSGVITKVTTSGSIKYGSAKVSRERGADTSNKEDRNIIDDDLGGATVTVTRGLVTSPAVVDGGVVDP